MLRIFIRRATVRGVEFCESCAQVCTGRHRSEAFRSRAREQVMRLRGVA